MVWNVPGLPASVMMLWPARLTLTWKRSAAEGISPGQPFPCRPRTSISGVLTDVSPLTTITKQRRGRGESPLRVRMVRRCSTRAVLSNQLSLLNVNWSYKLSNVPLRTTKNISRKVGIKIVSRRMICCLSERGARDVRRPSRGELFNKGTSCS